MRTRYALPLILVAAPLFAGGEYDAMHFGIRAGVAWAPDKSFGLLGARAPGTKATDASPMQFAGLLGFEAQYAAIPGKLNISLIVDGLDTIHKEMGTPSGVGGQVDQTILRGELRFGLGGRGNVTEGMHFWFSPTYNVVYTSNDLYGLHERKMGGAMGLLGTSFSERHISYWEVGVYVLPKLPSGTTAGKVNLEIKFGWLF